jgi:glycosyltransferase involved in cell wall biosynthesis
MESKVTALMPVKNGGVFLQRSLSQLQLSCNATDEILIIDDFSNDNTAQIVKDASKADARIRLLSNANPGIVGALNLGLSEASNEWIARFDVDEHSRCVESKETRTKLHSLGVVRVTMLKVLALDGKSRPLISSPAKRKCSPSVFIFPPKSNRDNCLDGTRFWKRPAH